MLLWLVSPYSRPADTAVATRERPAAGPAAGRRGARRPGRAARPPPGPAPGAGAAAGDRRRGHRRPADCWQLAAMILGDRVALPSVTQTVAQFAHYLDRPYPAQGKPSGTTCTSACGGS